MTIAALIAIGIALLMVLACAVMASWTENGR
jgi:hypothetical protein